MTTGTEEWLKDKLGSVVQEELAMIEWTENRDRWVHEVKKKLLLKVIAHVAKNDAAYGETEGDHREAAETILWLATRGKQGKDWCAGPVAVRHGKFRLWTRQE